MPLQLPSTADASVEPATPGSYGIAPPGYRLPDHTRVGAVRLQVADLARSLDWYQHILGFRVLAETGTMATLGSAGTAVPLIELKQKPGARPAPRRGRLGLFHFAILLPERAALGRFLAHVSQSGVQLGASDHLVSEALYLSDPDGLGIEVYADRPRHEWRRRGPEIAMATEPLDSRAVIAEARGVEWTGMPPGTSIGHVHLHVGDLDQAATFYHAGLGLDVMAWNYPGALFLGAGGYHHHLGVNLWAGRGATPPGPDDARLLEWQLLLPHNDDLTDSARSVSETGASVKQDAEGWEATDPWGTQLRVRPGPVPEQPLQPE